jgi:hypothetical protein
MEQEKEKEAQDMEPGTIVKCSNTAREERIV